MSVHVHKFVGTGPVPSRSRVQIFGAIVLAEAGAAGYAASGLDYPYLYGFTAGAAIFGAAVGLLVNQGRSQNGLQTPLKRSVSLQEPAAKSIYPTKSILIAPVLIGLAALCFALFAS